MVQITYPAMIFAISLIWVLVRLICALMYRKLNWKRELQLGGYYYGQGGQDNV